MLRPYDIIKKKRDGYKLSKEEIREIIERFLKGEIPSYQISALLMAIYFQGMDSEETFFLTDVMLHSGDIINLDFIEGKKVDKHSTGGVGDKISLILAPVVASCGVFVPMISGRGLGHTGGTLDKLESIPGFKTSLNLEEYKKILKDVGCVMAGQTGRFVPADKELYALRDVTATVDSIPLISASIMSKKLAEGIDGLVLDIKVGTGAFMKTIEKAKELAKSMVDIGKFMGKETVAIISDMNQPLGYYIGNSLEVKEVVYTLQGKGADDLINLTAELGAYMLKIASNVKDLEEGRKKIKEVINNGKGLEKFKEMVKAQGGDINAIENLDLLPIGKHEADIISTKKGYISNIDTEKLGISAVKLGAGREKVDSPIDHGVGFIIYKKLGDYVDKGEPLGRAYYNNENLFNEAKKLFIDSYQIEETPSKEIPKLIKEVIY